VNRSVKKLLTPIDPLNKNDSLIKTVVTLAKQLRVTKELSDSKQRKSMPNFSASKEFRVADRITKKFNSLPHIIITINNYK